MEISKNTLEELETPRRIFRSNTEPCVMPSKPRNSPFSLTDMFLKKREVMDIDELYPQVQKQNLFAGESKLTTIGEKRLERAATASKLFNEDTILQRPENEKEALVKEIVYKPRRHTVNLKCTPMDIGSFDDNKSFKNDFLSDDENFKRSIRCAISTKASLVNYQSTKQPSLVEINASLIKTSDFAQKLEASKSIEAFKKQRKMIAAERNQLKTRAHRISLFWNGKISFIPSAFRLFSVSPDYKKSITELQDFSLKGLNHVDADNEGSNFELYECQSTKSVNNKEADVTCEIIGLNPKIV